MEFWELRFTHYVEEDEEYKTETYFFRTMEQALSYVAHDKNEWNINIEEVHIEKRHLSYAKPVDMTKYADADLSNSFKEEA
jgi:hypothetical protein